MTQPRKPDIEQPPLKAVAPGDVVWVPVFACDENGGAPFWLRITDVTPVDGGHPYVRGVLVVDHHHASRTPEADRTISLRLPLDRVSRRIFVPVDQPARGVAQVSGTGALPRRPGGPQ